jgi:hypothetical protein
MLFVARFIPQDYPADLLESGQTRRMLHTVDSIDFERASVTLLRNISLRKYPGVEEVTSHPAPASRIFMVVVSVGLALLAISETSCIK